MFEQLDLIGVRLSLQRQLWTQPQLRAVSRRRRASRRRRLSRVVLGSPYPLGHRRDRRPHAGASTGGVPYV
jgi:hypothetical protein